MNILNPSFVTNHVGNDDAISFEILDGAGSDNAVGQCRLGGVVHRHDGPGFHGAGGSGAAFTHL